MESAEAKGVRLKYGLTSSAPAGATSGATALVAGMNNGRVKAKIQQQGVLVGTVTENGVAGIPPPPPASPPPPPRVDSPPPPPPRASSPSPSAGVVVAATTATPPSRSKSDVNVGAAVGGTFAACVVLVGIGIGVVLMVRNIRRDQAEIVRALSPPTSPALVASGSSPVHSVNPNEFGDDLTRQQAIMYGQGSIL